MKDLIQIFGIEILLGRSNVWDILWQKYLARKIMVPKTFRFDTTKADHIKSYKERNILYRINFFPPQSYKTFHNY